MSSALIPFLSGLVVAAGGLIPFVLRFRSAAAAASRRAAALESELEELKRGRVQLEEDQRSLTLFLKEFPHHARDLFSGLAERQLPPTLLNLIQKSLDPAQAVILVRKGQEARDTKFVVVAVSPVGGGPKIGTEVTVDRGELGYVAESQLVMAKSPASGRRAGPHQAGGRPPVRLSRGAPGAPRLRPGNPGDGGALAAASHGRRR